MINQIKHIQGNLFLDSWTSTACYKSFDTKTTSAKKKDFKDSLWTRKIQG